MATYPERRAALEKNSTAKTIWTLMLILQGIGAILFLLAIFGVSSLIAVGGPVTGSAVVGIAVTVGILGLAVSALVFWGIWRLENWIKWLLWISAILGLPGLFSRAFYTELISIAILIGYLWILKIVNGPSTPASTPPAPAQKM